MQRNFLFLQGCTCPFFNALGSLLEARGHGVARINFNVGDTLMWRAKKAWNFRGPINELAGFLGQLVERHDFTDFVMLGDTRPIHEAALSLANSHRLRQHIFEEGYFRPHWLTLERNGINGNSKLPKDPQWYRDVGERIPVNPSVESVSNSIPVLAAWELAYHLPNILNPILFPRYRTHRPVISPIEFTGWAWRFSRMPYFEWCDRQTITTLISGKQPFFVFPLQLNGDSQITHYSPFARIEDAIQYVMRSFARHSAESTILVIKNHPLDTGLVDFESIARNAAREFAIEGRYLYLESGSMDTLIKCASGIVTINSTVGNTALELDCPVMALGSAVYAIEGLVSGGVLDEFWKNPQPPDSSLYKLFKRTALFATQINGGFYSPRACRLAVGNAMRFLEPDYSPLEQLLK